MASCHVYLVISEIPFQAVSLKMEEVLGARRGKLKHLQSYDPEELIQHLSNLCGSIGPERGDGKHNTRQHKSPHTCRRRRQLYLVDHVRDVWDAANLVRDAG